MPRAVTTDVLRGMAARAREGRLGHAPSAGFVSSLEGRAVHVLENHVYVDGGVRCAGLFLKSGGDPGAPHRALVDLRVDDFNSLPTLEEASIALGLCGPDTDVVPL